MNHLTHTRPLLPGMTAFCAIGGPVLDARLIDGVYCTDSAPAPAYPRGLWEVRLPRDCEADGVQPYVQIGRVA